MFKSKLTLMQKNAWYGRLFLLPFLIGFIFFFLTPLVQCIIFSFCNVDIKIGGYNLDFIKFGNFYHIFREDLDYSTNLVNSLTQVVWKVPAILVVSIFLGIILNTKFHGRTFMRALAFLPAIISSGLVMETMSHDVIIDSMTSGKSVSAGAIIQSTGLQDLLINAGFNEKITTLFSTLSDNMFSILWLSGVQIVLFLTGLQGIPSSLYEAAHVEGATSWESFWKITFPMLLPTIEVTAVYTVVDLFTSTDNPVMRQVLAETNSIQLGWASSMSIIYSLVLGLVLFLIIFLFRKSENNNY